MSERTFTLTEDEFSSLILALGMATANAIGQGDETLAKRFLTITNRIEEGNPDWIPLVFQRLEDWPPGEVRILRYVTEFPPLNTTTEPPRRPFTCPICLAVSYHPEDLKQGYCGNCHAFTARPTQ